MAAADREAGLYGVYGGGNNGDVLDEQLVHISSNPPILSKQFCRCSG